MGISGVGQKLNLVVICNFDFFIYNLHNKQVKNRQKTKYPNAQETGDAN